MSPTARTDETLTLAWHRLGADLAESAQWPATKPAQWPATKPAPWPAVGAGLLARYREAHRGYHTTQHLGAVLATLDELVAPERVSPAVELAAWFHDAIYDPLASDNERRSADLARAELASCNLAEPLIETVAALVLATADHRLDEATTASGGAVLLDADLSILGADPMTYDRYAAGVRFEYGHLDDETFCTGRAKVLATLASRPTLFHTAAARQRFDRTARANLRREIDALLRQGASAATATGSPGSSERP